MGWLLKAAGGSLALAAGIAFTGLMTSTGYGDTAATTQAITDAAKTTAEAITAAAPAAPAASAVNTGSTTWLMISAALVLFMVPGLAFFYGGMVRAKNVVNTFLMVMACIGLVGVLWTAVGYAMTFAVAPTEKGADGKEFVTPTYFNFDSNLMFLKHFGAPSESSAGYKAIVTSGDTVGAVPTGVPEIVFFCFQGMFAIITPALIIGAVAERVRFGPFLLFVGLWALLVYNPVAHWVWNTSGWLFQKGVMDFAGGTVVHVLAGVSGLAACLVIGKRKGYDGKTPTMPHSIGLTLIGAGLLMVGWFGFNAGSAIAVPGSEHPVAGEVAALAFTTTFIAACTASFVWLLVEWAFTGKPTSLGFASGLVAGLVAITPCAGHVSPTAALIIGALGGAVCFFGCRIKYIFGYDDSLDAFGVHGIGGALGALLVGIFAIRPVTGSMSQLWLQFQGMAISAIYAFVVSLVLCLIIHKTIGMRATPEQEDKGMDVALHGEEGYHQAR